MLYIAINGPYKPLISHMRNIQNQLSLYRCGVCEGALTKWPDGGGGANW